ncbi:MAG: iron-regulated protein [bacterium]|nr:iron-regulated protein [bacterium]MCY4194578.1 iron-regulated protein [bacterium]MCY4272368.1 iron-regulated protein [bacterium]
MATFSSQVLVRVASVLAAFLLLAAGCGNDDDSFSVEVSRQDAVATYAAGVHSAYASSLYSAEAMDAAVDAFLTSPSEETLEAARQAWLVARVDYGPTEVFRFYGGPIDDDETGTEGLINAWPLDEAYIDYVEGNPSAGIVNDPSGYPEITADVIVALNEVGGEANVSTGWHAIEFLLWGQDLSEDGPGDRPASDYTTASNADRRAQYLRVASDQLVAHLHELVDAWAPGRDNYRARFEASDPDEALRLAFTGIGEMSRGELAGERMTVAYEARSQEDEHSCFSDNTTVDIVGNAVGVEMVLLGSYPGGVSGPGLLDVIASQDAALARQLRSEVSASVNSARLIPAPFDQHLRDGVSDDDPGRVQVLRTIEALETQTDTIVAAADKLGITINVS